MIYVSVPKEIKDYETHLALNLTFKQWVYLCVSFLFSMLLAGVCYLFVDESLVSYIIIFCTIPGLAFGFLKPMDLKFDVYIRYIFNFWRRKQKLTYNNEFNIYNTEKKGTNKSNDTTCEKRTSLSIKKRWKARRSESKRIKAKKELKETYIPKRIED